MADVLPHDASFLGHFDAARPTLVGMHGWNGETDGGSAHIHNILDDSNLQILDSLESIADWLTTSWPRATSMPSSSTGDR